MAAEGRRIATRLRTGRSADTPLSPDNEVVAKVFAPPRHSTAARLLKEGFAFSFFQAVRLLEQCFPGKVPVGYEGPPEDEVVHFRPLQSLSFPASQIWGIDAPARPELPAKMVVTFLGLTGPSGILPRHYTELLMRLEKEAKGLEKTALRDWLDLFNHRLSSLFYRAWGKYRIIIPFSRPDFLDSHRDIFTQALRSFIGLGLTGTRHRLRVAHWDGENPEHPERTLAKISDLSLVYFSGLLCQRPRSATALRALLEEYFQVPVQVKQFQGQWLQLEPDSRSALGLGDCNNQLGVNTVAGERVWDVQGRFRVRLGPLRFGRFSDFIPDRTVSSRRKAFFLLCHLIRLFAGPEFSFDVQVLLAASDVPECQLTGSEEGVGPLLGCNTWLCSREAEVDAPDSVFEGEELTWLNEAERLAATDRGSVWT